MSARVLGMSRPFDPCRAATRGLECLAPRHQAPIKNIRLCRWGVIRVIKARREYQGFIKVTREAIVKMLF